MKVISKIVFFFFLAMVNWLFYSYEDKLYNKQINHHYLENPILYILIEITNIPITFNLLRTNPLLPKKKKKNPTN